MHLLECGLRCWLFGLGRRSHYPVKRFEGEEGPLDWYTSIAIRFTSCKINNAGMIWEHGIFFDRQQVSVSM